MSDAPILHLSTCPANISPTAECTCGAGSTRTEAEARQIEIRFDEQIRCLRRELAMRQRVYPKWVATGRMKEPEMKRELASLQGVHDTLSEAIETLRLMSFAVDQGAKDQLMARGRKLLRETGVI